MCELSSESGSSVSSELMARRRDVKRVLRFEMAAEEVIDAKYEDMVAVSALSLSQIFLLLKPE
jgi:hypothetical protein